MPVFPTRWLIERAPWLIVLGLAAVGARMGLGAATAVTGVALIALGASAALAARRHVDPLVAGVQAVVYGCLYALFIGSALHQLPADERTAVAIDLALSAAVMACQLPVLIEIAQRPARS